MMTRPRYLFVFIAALIAGASYCVADRVIAPGALHVAWKGAGVALLACWAAVNARSGDGWQIAMVLALGAAGDVLLETHGLIVRAAASRGRHAAGVSRLLKCAR